MMNYRNNFLVVNVFRIERMGQGERKKDKIKDRQTGRKKTDIKKERKKTQIKKQN